MPAEIESFISAREVAWHRLGIVKDDWFTAEEALTEANLGYVVYKKPATLVLEDGTQVVSDEVFLTYRQHPETGLWQILGGVGSDYQIVQGVEHFRFMDEVVGNIGGAHYETAGSLRNGKQMFLSVSTESADLVLDRQGRSDTIKTYILGINSFDSSLAFGVIITPVRVVCANTLAMALGHGHQETDISRGRWFTKHTREVMNRAHAAAKTLGIYKSYQEMFADQAELMIHTPLPEDSFTRLIEGLYEDIRPGGITEKDREKMGRVRTLYELSPTEANIHGTVWGGLNAVTEHADWYTEVRGGKRSSVQELRFKRQIGFDADQTFKQQAWDRFYDFASENRPKLTVVP